MRNIAHIRRFSGTFAAPPDKSITHRAILLGGMAEGVTRVRGALLSDDCLRSVACMRALGARIEHSGDSLTIVGTRDFASCALDAGNSATTMRLLCGILAGRAGKWRLTGDKSLSQRPMRRVCDPLALLGGRVRCTEGTAPLFIEGAALHGADVELPVSSAQVKSAVLLAALSAEGETCVTEPVRSRDHTELLLRQMGVALQRTDTSVRLRGGQTLFGTETEVPGDISSAAYPLVAALLTGGEATVTGVGINPTRAGLLRVFEQIGADFELQNPRTCGAEPVADIRVRSLGAARPFRIDGALLPQLIDEVPVLAVLACYLSGESRVCDADELRHKESDRLAATVSLLRAFGGQAEVTQNTLCVRGKPLRGGCTVDPCGDHRMAMAAGVAAAASERGGGICGDECVGVSYPDFWALFNR